MMDSADDFPFDATQVIDSDGDGWGDNQQGTDPDKCPFQPGVHNGTLGLGCPVINNDDDDGNFWVGFEQEYFLWNNETLLRDNWNFNGRLYKSVIIQIRR